MALCIQTSCSLQWRLDELEKIIDSMENEIEATITQQQIQTDHDYTNIILRTAGKSIVSMREIIHLSAFGYPDGALSLARNIYEHVIILAFFENHKFVISSLSEALFNNDCVFQPASESLCLDITT